MTRIFLAAGVAALAIAAPAASKPGGNGGGHDHSQQAQQARGGGGGGHDKAQARGGGNDERGKAFRGGGDFRKVAEQRSKAREHAFERAKKANEQRFEARKRFAEQRSKGQEKAIERARKADEHRFERVREARKDQVERIREARRDQIERVRDVRDLRSDRFADRFDDRTAVGFGAGGCPPGLAKKPVACMPPGQAKKLLGSSVNDVARVAALSQLPLRLQGIYPDTPDYYYRYGDNGYIYRVNRSDNLVNSLLPLFGLGYGIGQPFPTGYSGYGMPAAYQPFYPDTPYADYRYANGYVYQIDPYTGLIEDVDPALGYGYGFGQAMPLSYSAYNVPYDYRPFYQDTSDAYYRYAPGAIYQVDPKTSLITAVAALLSPGLTVGQPLPMGYSAYNVPYDYRANYYDTPDAMYRYANGNIYRVDPATQLVTALVTSILT